MEQTRPGSAHCANGILDFLKTLLDRLCPKMKKVTVRIDAGPFSLKLVTLLESYDNVIYELAVPQKGALKRKIRALKYKSYYGREREYSSFGNLKRRYYVQRSLRKPGSQLDLLEEFNYRVVISNDLQRQPHTLFDHYNKRGDDEKNFAELKNEYALGKMVSGDFAVTKALFWVSFLTFTIIGIFRKVALRMEYAHYRLRRLRFKLFSNIAYFVDHARQRVLNIACPAMGKNRFNILLRRIWLL